jgi:LysM repeat protein
MKRGETLPQVAARYGMSIETLRSVNGIGPRETVPAGYALLVPMQRPTAEAAASLEDAVFTTVPMNRTFYYTVRRGDSLTEIAARYGVTIPDLKRWNHLARETVRTGQKLRVTSDVPPARSAQLHRGGHTVKVRNAKGSHHGVTAVRTAGGGGGGGKPKTTSMTTPAAKP